MAPAHGVPTPVQKNASPARGVPASSAFSGIVFSTGLSGHGVGQPGDGDRALFALRSASSVREGGLGLLLPLFRLVGLFLVQGVGLSQTWLPMKLAYIELSLFHLGPLM